MRRFTLGTIVFGITAASLAVLGVCQSAKTASDYKAEIQKFRDQATADLKKDKGWLTVAGLEWLKDGVPLYFHSAGSHVAFSEIKPKDAIGSFTRDNNAVRLSVIPNKTDAAGNHVRVNDKVVTTSDLKADSTGKPDETILGAVTMTIIQRGKRLGIRVHDNDSQARKEFKGQNWFPIDQKFCFKAKYIAYETPKTMPITNVLGDIAPVPNPGYVQFSLDGKSYRLEAQDAGSGFFFNFKDLTSGKSTYPAGRFLDTSKAVDGFVTLDFNKAVNPPCAFTSFATCPLPPQSNSLNVEIMAGEMTYHAHAPPAESHTLTSPSFRSNQLFEEHYQKHVLDQREFGSGVSKDQYLQMARAFFNVKSNKKLNKYRSNGDILHYNPDTNEFGVVAGDGIIRTYFKPSNGRAYWDRQ